MDRRQQFCIPLRMHQKSNGRQQLSDAGQSTVLRQGPHASPEARRNNVGIFANSIGRRHSFG